MSDPRRVLWVSGYHPHPPDAGLTAYTAGLSEAAAQHPGLSIRGIGLLGEPPLGPPTSETAVRWSLAPGTRRSPARALTSQLPSMAATLAVPALRSLAAEELRRGLNVVVIDHLQSGWILDLLPVADGPSVVYLSHNDEETVRAEVAANAGWGPRDLAVRLDARKIRRLERRVLARADLLTTITEADAAQMSPRTKGAQVEVVTPGWAGVPVPQRKIDQTVPRRSVLLGNLHWSVKRTNTERFLRVADPLYAAAGAEITVIGPAPQEWVDALRPSLRATTFVGWVDDPAELLAQSRIGVVSEHAGGGFKMKSLDFTLRRLPMIALTGTVAGLPLVSGADYLEEPDESALAQRSLTLMDDLDTLNAMQENSFSACSSFAGWQRSGDVLAEALLAIRR